MNIENKLPELLLPAGNIEAFFAAVEGGADAVYLGLKNFNARGRAKNFTIGQLQSILKEAEIAKVKVYVTLNTLIKNFELADLIDTLYLLSQTTVSAVIIQDLGTYYIAHKFFPSLTLHASTQMSIHNSLGAEFMREKGFERVILARELTLSELKKIVKRTSVELEIFTHGALCYSFSGQCLFSSYLGGMSANRGLCRQPCRRIYTDNSKEKYLFNLKDNQQIGLVSEFKKLGISSLKIEGRMKSAEYVFNTAKAYRMALENEDKTEISNRISKDLAREKTAYFMGGDVSNAITGKPYTGDHIGNIQECSSKKFKFFSKYKPINGNRLRVLPKSGMNSAAFKLRDNFSYEESEKGYLISIDQENTFDVGDLIFLVGFGDLKFKNKFTLHGKKLNLRMGKGKRQNILNKIGSSKIETTEQIFVRVNSIKWMMKIYLPKIDYLILKLDKEEWLQFNPKTGFIQKNIEKIFIELPKFIAEDEIEFYRDLCIRMHRTGIKNFMLSHISQKLILPKKKDIKISTNENVYTLNDAAIQMLKEEKIGYYTYPQEVDFQNLLDGKDRNGIMPVYFYPELFYSRMPIDLKNEEKFQDKTDTFHKTVVNGITIVLPNRPVSFLQYKRKLADKGFRNYLLDFSYTKPSQNTFNRILKKLENSEAEQPSTNFNFKLGLK